MNDYPNCACHIVIEMSLGLCHLTTTKCPKKKKEFLNSKTKHLLCRGKSKGKSKTMKTEINEVRIIL